MTIGGRRLDEAPVEDTIDLVAPEKTLDTESSQRRREFGMPSIHNCYSYDLPEYWTDAKQEWCCSNMHIACEFSQPFNCYTRDLECHWTEAKKEYCCRTANKGCLTNIPVVEVYNCYTRDLESNWTEAKKEYCCQTANKGCLTNIPVQTPEVMDLCEGKSCGDVCDTSQGMLMVMRYCQPDGSCGSNSAPACDAERYNCRTRDSWSGLKRRYCCSTYGLGCRNGPSIGRRAEVDAQE